MEVANTSGGLRRISKATRSKKRIMNVVSFSIFKGGTGKTTSAVSTAAALTKKGKRVLLVDLDQQASSTRYLGLDPDEAPTLFEVFMKSKSVQTVVRQTKFGIDVL